MSRHEESTPRAQPRTTPHEGTNGYTYRDELALVERFASLVEVELAGRSKTRITNTWPQDICQVCVLPPPQTPPTEAEAMKWASGEGNTHMASGQNERTENHDLDRERASLRKNPSNLGVEFVAKPVDGTVALDVSLSFAFYTRRFPTLAEQTEALETAQAEKTTHVSGEEGQGDDRAVTLVDVFQRNEISIPSIHIELAAQTGRQVSWHPAEIQAGIDKSLKLDELARDSYRIGRAVSLPIAVLGDETTYKAFLDSRTEDRPRSRDPVAATLEVRAWKTNEDLRVACYIRNLTPSSRNAMTDNCRLLADARIQVAIVNGNLVPIELLPMPRDYQFDRTVWCLGHGTSTFVSADGRTISSQGIARQYQPRLSARTHPSISFAELAESPLTALEEVRSSMEEYWREWNSDVLQRNSRRLSSEALQQCRKDYDAFRFEIELFTKGIAALRTDERLLCSFQAMNRVFGRLARGQYERWRLFQIVFIVAQLPALAVREGFESGEYPLGRKHEWSDTVDRADVLWFPTGGGKTEAYMALVSCACLYDRLRGKSFGVTAWLRFPLRMLSVQQLQRAMGMIWETEVERRSLLGSGAGLSDPISLGYFVGKGSTPNWLDVDGLRELESEEAADRLRVITDCPACWQKGSVRVVGDTEAVRAKHVCSSCGAELPLYVIDDEIYRYLPSLLVGTVDKAATVSFQANLPLLWGAAHWRCPVHGFGLKFGCRRCRKAGRSPIESEGHLTRVTPYDPSPSFHIQDELHLLQEELGTFAGHYETLLQYCESAIGGRRPKILAATATIEGYERHARHLYGSRSVARFPGRGFDRYNTFYAEEARTSVGRSSSDVARLFLAIRPASAHHVSAAGRCAEIILEEIARLSEDPAALAESLPDCSSPAGAMSLLVQYSTLLTYVGSLPNGARINEQLKTRSLVLRSEGQRELLVEFHSGRSSASQLAGLIDRTQNPPPWQDEGFLDVVIATDVISHGVDLERLNLMIMDSVPEEIGRYIQVSSRCGRTHVGLVIGLLPAFSRRASSIYHRFREFHANLEMMINPVPVNRFAKHAITRTAPGILAGIILGRVNPLVTEDLRVRRFVAALLASEGTTLPGAKSPFALLEEAAAAYALGRGIYPAGLEESFLRRLQTEVDRFRYLVRGSREEYLLQALNPRPMTSLRDVERGVPFGPDPDSFEEAVWFSNARGGQHV